MDLPSSHEILCVPLNRVDIQDRTFAITPRWSLEDPLLTRSIRFAGVVSPVLLQGARDGPYRLVSGFKRFASAAKLGFETIPATLATDREPSSLFLKSVCQNVGNRSLNAIENANIVRKLSEFGKTPAEIQSEILPLLGLTPSRYRLRQLERIAALPEVLQRGVCQNLTHEVALQLVSWGSSEQNLFLQLIDRFQLGVNKQKQIFELLNEIRTIRGLEIKAIWDLVNDQAAGELDSFHLLRGALRHLRYPRLTRHENRYKELKSSLRLPSQVSLSVPPFFEGDRLEILIRVKSVAELQEVLRSLGARSSSTRMTELFDLL